MSKMTEDLVFALCHELGNLVGAIRLNAHLIDGDSSQVELANVSVDIDDSSTRIRSLLALVRPLVQGGDAPGAGGDELLADVAEALEEYGGRGVEIEVPSASGLPQVAGRRDALHHLLLSFAYYAVEEARPRGRVVVTALRSDEGPVTFRVEDDGPEEPGLGEAAADRATGRTLVLAIADVILGRWGGGVKAVRDGRTTRIELQLPAL
jgi:signal transduction histidine kinase